MPTKKELPTDVTRWLQEQASGLWPAALGSLSFRRTRCIRENCKACRSGEQHASHVLYVRMKGRRFAIYIPDEIVSDVQRSLDNGRELQDLLAQAAIRYAKALKHERTAKVQKIQKVKK